MSRRTAGRVLTEQLRDVRGAGGRDSVDGEEAHAELRRINWYAATPLTFDASRRMRTVVMVALRDVGDEELFADYSFGGGPTSSAPPEWYVPVRDR